MARRLIVYLLALLIALPLIVLSGGVAAAQPVLSRTDIFVTGAKNCGTAGNENVLFRMDKDGNILWTRTVPCDIATLRYADRNLTEDSFYLNISPDRNDLRDGKGRILKFNAEGNIEWDLPLTTDTYSVSANPVDGGAYVSDRGWYFRYGTDQGIYKIDAAGNIVWGPKAFGYSGSGWVVSTDVTSGGAFVANDECNVVIKIDRDGNVIWTRNIEHPFDTGFNACPSDGGVYVGSGVWGNTHTYKLDADGNIQWALHNFPSPWTYWRAVSPLDGAISIISGWENYLAKIATDGSVVWKAPRAGGFGAESLAADIQENMLYTGDGYEVLGISKVNGADGSIIWHVDPGYYQFQGGYGPGYFLFTGMPSMVSQQAVTIDWPNPADITYGTALDSTQLCATASVNGTPVVGTFDYTPDQGTVLDAGNGQTLSVHFTPADTNSYSTADMDVNINVMPKPITVTADAQIKIRGEADPVLTYSCNPPLLPGDNFSGSLERLGDETAGDCDIVLGTLSAGPNYAIIFVPAHLSIHFLYIGILQPINPDGSSCFKKGCTIPLKFQLKDANGFVGDQTVSLCLFKISSSALGPVNEPVTAESTCAATTGTLFRYDAASNLYIFNLSTKVLAAPAMYLIRINLGDGTSHDAIISLR